MKTKNNDDTLNSINAGGTEEFEVKEQTDETIPEASDSLGKFKNVEDLLKAYNCLEAEFTKRSQRLRELERELSNVKNEQTAAQSDEPVLTMTNADAVQDETGSAAEGFAGDVADSFELRYDEGCIAVEVSDFLTDFPEAVGYAERIAEATSKNRDLSKGFLQKAYVEVLRDELRREREKINDDFILEKAIESPFIKEQIIKDYLSGITANKSVRLISGGGEIAVIPPSRPKNIWQAGEMAASVLRKKN